MGEQWYASRDGEIYDCGPYASQEEAIANAPAEFELGADGFFSVGRGVPVTVNEGIDVWGFLEGFVERLSEEHGEWAEPWVDAVREVERKPGAQAELEAALVAVMTEWLTRHDAMPVFFGIKDATEHWVGEGERNG